MAVYGTNPPNCIDRRPIYTGWPNLTSCEFDGRLSLAHHNGEYRLYARANLRFGATFGGRFVQTTTSNDTRVGHWRPWQLVDIQGVPSGSADIYFFAVHANPVLEGTLIALFPLSQPPHACSAMAFSRDGVRFSRPVNLRTASLGWRTHNADGTGTIEWRSEDHPAAGVVLRSTVSGEKVVWVYLHHRVHGMSMRQPTSDDPVDGAYVARYEIPARQLRRLARASLAKLTD